MTALSQNEKALLDAARDGSTTWQKALTFEKIAW